jgi:hypothetical protein
MFALLTASLHFATAFVGMKGSIDEIQLRADGMETMTRHIVVFDPREKRVFNRCELALVPKTKTYEIFVQKWGQTHRAFAQ